MIQRLELQHVGPVDPLYANFGERLNVITGDNGLGKSFLLDVCFWALTGTWPGGRTAMPKPGVKDGKPTISYQLGNEASAEETQSAFFNYRSQSWSRPNDSPETLGLALYAGVDGGFYVWDSARNYSRDPLAGGARLSANPATYQFSASELADGLRSNGTQLCNGLIQDWVEWYYQRLSSTELVAKPFEILEEVISLLSHPSEPLRCVEPRKVFVDDARKFPALEMPYGIVPYPHWSAGVKRIVNLAYLIVWAWVEHTRAAELRHEEPTSQVVLIIDELESHLHPRWQRSILPSLLRIVEHLRSDVQSQILCTTHSPLTLASLEPHFDTERDQFFCFTLSDTEVRFESVPWAMHGDVVAWLTSDVFGLEQARSTEAERAIEAAEAYLRGEHSALPSNLRRKEEITNELRRVLPGLDPFWPRWVVGAKP